MPSHVRLRFVHPRRAAEARNAKPAVRQLFLRLLNPRRAEFRALREIHGFLDAAQLDRREAVLRREVEDRNPVPGRTAERREAERRLAAAGLHRDRGKGERGRERLEKGSAMHAGYHMADRARHSLLRRRHARRGSGGRRGCTPPSGPQGAPTRPHHRGDRRVAVRVPGPARPGGRHRATRRDVPSRRVHRPSHRSPRQFPEVSPRAA